MLRKLIQRLSRHAARRLVAEGERAEAAGRFDEARERYQTALKFVPDYAPAYLGLGLALEGGGHLRAASDAYRSALELAPDDASAHFNLGRLLHVSGNAASQAEAERELRAALEQRPGFTDARVMLASVLEARGETGGATQMLAEAVRQQPDAAGAWYNYALLLHRTGRIADAEAAMRRTLELWPERAEVWTRQGELLKLLQRLPEAEAALRRALALDPGLSAAYRLLAGVLLEELRPAEAFQVLADGRQHPDGQNRAYELAMRQFDEAVSAEALFEEHRAFAAEIESVQLPRFHGFAGTRDPERKLRIGFLSSDFCFHPVGRSFLPLIENLDRARYDPFCYSLSPAIDDLTRGIAARAMQWNEVSRSTQREIAGIIHGDRIDVLVDLIGFGGLSCLEILASKPAPVQASWLGYLSSTGLTRVDYRITDPRSDPPGEADRLHTEKLLRLPHSQWCYRPPPTAEPAAAPPCTRNGFFTFGAFVHAAKLSPTTWRLWADILRRTPGAKLLVVGVPPGPATQTLMQELTGLGIDAGRIAISARRPVEEYFKTLRSVDLVLDTTPYSGGTTACDSLWMGTPVLTLPGSRSVSRSASSILGALGMQAWMAKTPEDYVERAVRATADPAWFAAERRGLRERMLASPLMDEAQFARDMEALFRQMWRGYCATVNS